MPVNKNRQLKLMSVSDFKKSGVRGVKVENRYIEKRFKAEEGKAVDVQELYRERTGSDPTDDANLLAYIISSERRDRDGDIIKLDGWNLVTWKEKPAVLFAHDHQQPIARGVDAWIDGDFLWSLAEYPTAEVNPFAHMMYQMAKKGFTPQSASVGFIPTDWKFDEEAEGDYWYPIVFMAQELIEWSMVSVGSNRDAEVSPELMKAAKAAGIDTAPMARYVSELLDDGRRSRGVSLSPGELEKLYAATREEKTLVMVTPKTAAPGNKSPEKDGRVLSSANETRIRDARGLLDQVLDQLEAEEEGVSAEAFLKFLQADDKTSFSAPDFPVELVKLILSGKGYVMRIVPESGRRAITQDASPESGRRGVVEEVGEKTGTAGGKLSQEDIREIAATAVEDAFSGFQQRLKRELTGKLD